MKRNLRTTSLAIAVAAAMSLGVMVFAAPSLPVAEASLVPAGSTDCPAATVDYTFLAYDGPVGITGACLAHYQYTGGRLTVVAYDAASDGLFRSSFDVVEEG